jgi:hypothetical protein
VHRTLVASAQSIAPRSSEPRLVDWRMPPTPDEC